MENASDNINLFRALFKGRQSVLEITPNNFKIIMHDYSDDNKGFVIWKSAVEEVI